MIIFVIEIFISGSGSSSAPSRGIKFGNWVEELHYTQHPEEVLFQFYVIKCIQQFPIISFVSTLTTLLQVLFQFYTIKCIQQFPTFFLSTLTTLLQVERKKAKGGNTSVGLFNPMRFLHSIETWKKEETEVQSKSFFEEQRREKDRNPLQHFQHGGQVLLQLDQQGDGHGGQVLLLHLLLS